MTGPPSPAVATGRGARIGLAALLFAFNLALQLGLGARGLDDEPMNALHPTAHDALEYVRAAEALAEGRDLASGLTEAFGTGWRTPGYSLFLSMFERSFDEPWRAARIAQILLTAAIAPVVLWMLSALVPLPAALAGAAVAATWLPLYHYSAALVAEPLSLFLMAVLLLLLSRRGLAGRPGIWAAAGATVAALVYLKPNHLLLLVPVCGFLLAAEGRRGWGAAVAVTALAVILIAPWSAWVSRQQGTFVALSTTSGYNLYLGTGVPPVGIDDGSLPARAARATGLRGGTEDLPRDPESVEGAWKSAAWSAELGRKARATWAERPLASSLHGAAKALHAFGFSLRGARDALLALFFAAAMAAGAALRRDRAARPWVVFMALCTLVVALQAFVWLPNQRLKTVMFDLPALLVLSLAVAEGWRRIRRPATP